MNLLSYLAEQSDIQYVFDLCKNSPYVKSNASYLQKAEHTKVVLLTTVQLINASANNQSTEKYKISVFNGLSNMFVLVSTALAYYDKTNNIEKLIKTCRWIGDRAVECDYTFNENSLNDGMKEFNYKLSDSVMQESVSYFSGTLLGIIGHELGHICLSHLDRGPINNQTSRNDERSADLFAQSIISTTPFAKYTILSSLFIEIMFTWLTRNNDIATTHPYSKERVYNVLTSHEEYLRSVRITKENIQDFLP